MMMMMMMMIIIIIIIIIILKPRMYRDKKERMISAGDQSHLKTVKYVHVCQTLWQWERDQKSQFTPRNNIFVIVFLLVSGWSS